MSLQQEDGSSTFTRKEKESLATFENFTYTLCHFLEVAIHQIIYNRGIYPKELFHVTNNYNIGTHTCRHPQVIKWIRDAIMALSEELLKNCVRRVALVILSPNDISLERFIFDMSRFPLTSDIDVKYNAPMLQPGAEVPPSRQALANLEREFQTCLVKLKYSNISLGKIPEDSTFGLAIELNDDQAAPNNYTDTWMPCERQPVSNNSKKSVVSAPDCEKITGIRTIREGAFTFNIWIEESKAKSKLVV
ncbi:uncharacterized protein LAJ45_01389 [Morchella importuna]|uniref:uncharacterized protein n=1 Tax=Morchella importuna TaxID=1174673 RepID=UPI001E8CA5D0|nr:uncharacterized protein LAJ45_01389 [Morchella importuna]KAH8154858.1 hypothetical protein LAJ45_01389 [Morchella importuna]